MASASPEKGRSPSPKSRSKLAAKQVLIERLHRCFVYMSNFDEKESINEQLKPLQTRLATLVHRKIRGNKKAGLSTSNNGSVEIIGGSCSDALTEKNGNIIANGCECLGNWLNVDGTGDIKYM